MNILQILYWVLKEIEISNHIRALNIQIRERRMIIIKITIKKTTEIKSGDHK